jgi:outer membrane receptor protein involved in Fe transport
VEKIFTFGARKDRLALYADISNVFNKTLITDVLRRVPTTTVTVAPGETTPVAFEAPGAINAPRQTILGARWSF